jgi:hypothetical protein
MKANIILVSILLAGCVANAFSQESAAEKQAEAAALAAGYGKVAVEQAKTNARYDAFVAVLRKQMNARETASRAQTAPQTPQQIAFALKQSRTPVSVAFSKAAMKTVGAIEHYDGQLESRHRIDAALEDVEIEASTKAENNEVTALKNMALNLEAAVDIDLRTFTAIEEWKSRLQEYGIDDPLKWTPMVTAKLAGDGYCFPSWKDALKTRKASLPNQCRAGAGDYLFSDFAP